MQLMQENVGEEHKIQRKTHTLRLKIKENKEAVYLGQQQKLYSRRRAWALQDC